MKTTLILLILALSTPAHSGWYFELGVGLHNLDASLPEVNLPGPLGRFAIGLEAQEGFSIEIEHLSSVPLQEQGSGLNTLWITKRVYFK